MFQISVVTIVVRRLPTLFVRINSSQLRTWFSSTKSSSFVSMDKKNGEMFQLLSVWRNPYFPKRSTWLQSSSIKVPCRPATIPPSVFETVTGFTSTTRKWLQWRIYHTFLRAFLDVRPISSTKSPRAVHLQSLKVHKTELPKLTEIKSTRPHQVI